MKYVTDATVLQQVALKAQCHGCHRVGDGPACFRHIDLLYGLAIDLLGC